MARGAASTVARTPTTITPQERVTALQRRCPLSPPVCSISHETECTNVAATALQAVSPDVLREAQGPLLRGEEEGIRPSAEMATLGRRARRLLQIWDQCNGVLCRMYSQLDGAGLPGSVQDKILHDLNDGSLGGNLGVEN